MLRWLAPLTIVLFLLSGCVSENSGISLFNPYTGTKALDIHFVNNAPPQIVYSGTPFRIGFELTNYGALDINNGIITIGITDYNNNALKQDTINFNLKGKKSTKTFRGEKDYKIVSAKAPELEGKAESELIVNYIACFPYRTFLQTGICVNPDPYTPTPKNCVPRPLSFSGQGAPVAVTRVEQSVIPVDDKHSKLMFTIYIENQGDGFVVSRNAYHKVCKNIPLNVEDVDVVSVSASLAGEKLTCVPKLVSVENGASTTCYSDDMLIKPSYKTILSVTLDYGYFKSDTKSILLVKTNLP